MSGDGPAVMIVAPMTAVRSDFTTGRVPLQSPTDRFYLIIKIITELMLGFFSLYGGKKLDHSTELETCTGTAAQNCGAQISSRPQQNVSCPGIQSIKMLLMTETVSNQATFANLQR